MLWRGQNKNKYRDVCRFLVFSNLGCCIHLNHIRISSQRWTKAAPFVCIRESQLSWDVSFGLFSGPTMIRKARLTALLASMWPSPRSATAARRHREEGMGTAGFLQGQERCLGPEASRHSLSITLHTVKLTGPNKYVKMSLFVPRITWNPSNHFGK